MENLKNWMVETANIMFDDSKNDLRSLPKSVRLQILIVLSFVWSTVFSLYVFSVTSFIFGWAGVVMAHIGLIIAVYLTFKFFHNQANDEDFFIFTRVGRDFPKWRNRLVSLGFRTPLDKVTLMQNFRHLGCVTAVRRAFIVFAKRYIRSKFQSCQIELKLKMQSLLTHLISKLPRLSILTHKCGFY